MIIEQCYPFNLTVLSSLAFECFSMSKDSPKFFGFAELISGLALTLVVWTIADLRYKFRIETSSIPIKKISVITVICIGILTILTDYWRSSQSRVPLGAFLTPESWQLFLGASFFMILIIWFWFAFLKPTKFSKWNAKKFSLNVERYLLRGSTSELSIIADELTRSISTIIKYAKIPIEDEKNIKVPDPQVSAYKILMAIANPKFSKAIVEGAPRLIIHLFNSVNEQKYYGDEIQLITKNILTAAILNPNSFLYNENDFYTSGLEGITQPVITAIYQNPELIKEIDTLLHLEKNNLDINQWNAYCRLILTTFTTHLNGNTSEKPYCLHWAYLSLQTIYSDLTSNLKLTDIKRDSDLYSKLHILGKLIKDMIGILNEKEAENTIYFAQATTDITEIIFSLIKAASSVREPQKVSRIIQEKLIWSDILNSSELDTVAGQQILNEVHNKLLIHIKTSPNLDGVTILSFCINVMISTGFTPQKNGYYQMSYEFYIEFIKWLKKHLKKLCDTYPNISREYFVEGTYYDTKNNRLVFKHQNKKNLTNSEFYFNL